MVAAASMAAAAEVDGSQSLPAPATATVPSKPATADAPTKPPSRFRDTEDGQLDLSYLRASPRAFPPIPLIITEPAVGYGLGATALFLRPRQEAGEQGWARPNASVLGGFATQNGTWMAMGGDASRWLDGRLRSLAGAGVGKINLDFYGRDGGWG